jgi:hypothetical protein
MAVTKNSFVIRHLPGGGGNFIDSQYLAASFDTGKPHMLQNTMTRIFSSTSRFWSNNLLMAMTGGKVGGTKITIDQEVYRWKLQGAEYKQTLSLGILDAANTLPGLNGSTFRIWVDNNYFMRPDVLLGEDNEYPLQIVDGPTPYGGGYVYTVLIQGDNPAVAVAQSMLEAGKTFSKAWTSVQSEFNKDYGTQEFPGSFELESQIGAFAEKQTITDKAWRDSGKLAFDFIVEDKKTGMMKKYTSFLPYAEAMMNWNLTRGMEVQSILGKKQTKPAGDRYWIKTGPGVREQLKDSWLEYYNGALTVNRMKDYLMDILVTRTDEVDRKMIGISGTVGAFAFHDMLANEYSGYLTVDTNFTEKIKNSPRHLSFGAQFTHYQGPQGLEVTMITNKMYDDTRYCSRMHPQYPNLPIDSQRITFLDFGTRGVNNNIMQLQVANTFKYGYVAGTHTPNGPITNGQFGGLIDGYEVATGGTHGIVIIDPTGCGELIYDSEY